MEFYRVHWKMTGSPAEPTAIHVPPRRAKKLAQEPKISSQTACNRQCSAPRPQE